MIVIMDKLMSISGRAFHKINVEDDEIKNYDLGCWYGGVFVMRRGSGIWVVPIPTFRLNQYPILLY